MNDKDFNEILPELRCKDLMSVTFKVYHPKTEVSRPGRAASSVVKLENENSLACSFHPPSCGSRDGEEENKTEY